MGLQSAKVTFKVSAEYCDNINDQVGGWNLDENNDYYISILKMLTVLLTASSHSSKIYFTSTRNE